METVFVMSIAITFIFFFLKVLEMKYIQKDIRPLKETIRDSVIVLGSSMVSLSLFYYAGGSMNDFFNILVDLWNFTKPSPVNNSAGVSRSWRSLINSRESFDIKFTIWFRKSGKSNWFMVYL